MSFHNHRATWRGITFNTHMLDDGSFLPEDPRNLVEANVNSAYYLDQLDISRVSVQDYRELRQFLEGTEPNEAFEGVRALNGVGRIVAANAADLEDRTWAMFEAFSVAACRIAAMSADPVGVLPFTGYRDTLPLVGDVPTRKQLRFYCRPGPGRPVIVGRIREGLIRPFTFQLIAFDPFAYDETETQTTIAVGGGNVTNPGSIYTRPKIRLTFGGAGATNLTLTNGATGKSIVINASTAANGEVWIIDVARSTIVRASDGANRYSQRVSGFLSDLWLQPGVNAVSTANTTNLTGIRFDFRGAYA